MGVDSNTVHVRVDDPDVVVKVYSSWLRRAGYRARAESGIPGYRETREEPVFRRVLVSPAVDGWVTVVDQKHDHQRLRGIRAACQALTRATGAVGIATIVHDSEVLYYFAFEAGQLVDRYCSWPGWYSEEPPSHRVRERWKGSPEKMLPLCVPGVTLEQLQALLRDYSLETDEEGAPPWPEDVLRDLARCLGISDSPRTYASYHARPRRLFLALPTDVKEGRGVLRIGGDEEERPQWVGWTHLNFMKVLR